MDTLLRWPALLAEHEQALDADCIPLGPFLTIAQKQACYYAANQVFHAIWDDLPLGPQIDLLLLRAAVELERVGLPDVAAEVDAIQRFSGDGTDMNKLETRLRKLASGDADVLDRLGERR